MKRITMLRSAEASPNGWRVDALAPGQVLTSPPWPEFVLDALTGAGHAEETKPDISVIETKDTATPPEVAQDGPGQVSGGIAQGPAGEPAAVLTGGLPDDFPARDKLSAAGLTTFEALSEFLDAKGGRDALESITGVGPASAKSIWQALGHTEV